MRLGRRYHVAAQHEELRLLRTGQPWDHALHDPALPHLGLADAGILGGDDNVAPQRQFQTAAQAVPMDARDQQLLAVPHAKLTRVVALEGLPQCSIWIGSSPGARSAPALNAWPLATSAIALTSGSSSPFTMAASRSRHSSRLSAFILAGRLSVITATFSSLR